MGCGSTNELVEIQRSNVESAEWAGLESDRMSESSHSLRANKSLQSQYTQENPKVINGLHIIKDAFQHINTLIYDLNGIANERAYRNWETFLL